MITYKNACEEICEEAEEWEPEVVGEEEDLVEEVILPGVDWESVCYQVLNLFTFSYLPIVLSSYLPIGVNLSQFISNLPQFYPLVYWESVCCQLPVKKAFQVSSSSYWSLFVM